MGENKRLKCSAGTTFQDSRQEMVDMLIKERKVQTQRVEVQGEVWDIIPWDNGFYRECGIVVLIEGELMRVPWESVIGVIAIGD